MFRVKRNELDNTGRMRAWKIDSGEWIWAYPVDVLEMMRRGAVVLDEPLKETIVTEAPRRGRPPKAAANE